MKFRCTLHNSYMQNYGDEAPSQDDLPDRKTGREYQMKQKIFSEAKLSNYSLISYSTLAFDSYPTLVSYNGLCHCCPQAPCA